MNEHVALVVDDTPEILEQLEEILESIGHQCLRASTQEEAEALLDARRFCYVLLDLEMPVKANRVPRVQTGYNLLDRIRAEHPADDLPVIVMTAHGSGHTYATRAFKRGASDFIQKPFDADEQPIDDKIREALEKTCEARHATCPNVDGAIAEPDPPRSRRRKKKAKKPASPRPAGRKGTKRRPVIRLVGFLRDRRYLIEVNGKEVRLRGASLDTLCHLAGGLLNEEQPGWVSGTALGNNPHNAIYRLRQDLGASIHRDVIVKDGHGKYRLSTEPENIEIADSFRQDHSRLCKILDGLA